MTLFAVVMSIVVELTDEGVKLDAVILYNIIFVC